MPDAPGRHGSLRVTLLRRLLPAMLALLLGSATIAYWIAWRSATKAYDRGLADSTLAIAEQLHLHNGEVHLPLTQQAREVLLADHYDQVFYAVRGPDGRLLDGEHRLPLAPENLRGDKDRYYFDAKLDQQPIRVAVLERELAGQKLTILAGETMVKRNALIREILFGMLLPELLLVALSLLIVWFGVRSGLRPLDGLRHELAGRSHTDLRPLGTDVPQEMQPMVQEINGLLQRLADSLDSQRNFVSDAAHQLRTPIAALQAQVEAALRDAPEAARPRLSGVRNACERLAHLVSQLLALARAEPSLAQTDPEIELAEILHACAETWLPSAIARGIDLGFEVAPARVRGNRLLLQELLGNLVDNALRHAPDGGAVTVACAADDGGRCRLTVEDNGPGIPRGEQEKIFERFYRPPGSRSDGCGLGLAIVRAIARQHGGQVGAERSPRLGGALFTVSLPATPLPRPGPAEREEGGTARGA